jgi:hypothetical protein
LNKQCSIPRWSFLITFALLLPSAILAQTNINPKLPAQENLALRQEIEINHRSQIIDVTQKAIVCMKNAKTVGAIKVCKNEESYELSVIKKQKKESDALFLKK